MLRQLTEHHLCGRYGAPEVKTFGAANSEREFGSAAEPEI